MPTRYLRPSQSIRVDSRSPKWPRRSGSLSSSSRTRARLGARTDRCNSIVARFTNAAATGVSTHIEPPAAPAAMRSKPPVAHLAAFREWGSVPSCRVIEPHRSRSTLNGGFYLCRVMGLSPRRTSGNRRALQTSHARHPIEQPAFHHPPLAAALPFRPNHRLQSASAPHQLHSQLQNPRRRCQNPSPSGAVPRR